MKRTCRVPYALMLVVVLSLSGCLSKGIPITTTVPSLEVVATNTISAPATGTPGLLSAADVERIVYDDDYLKGCQESFSKAPTSQVGLKEIYPGRSTPDDLLKKFGEPSQYSETNDIQEYYYSDSLSSFVYRFYIKKGYVESIIVSADNELLSSLQELLEHYGCPNLIVAENLTEGAVAAPASFDAITFWYLDGGLWIHFDSYPITNADKPFSLGFEAPKSLSSFTFDQDTYTPVPFSTGFPHP